jgi:hypothetical protein
MRLDQTDDNPNPIRNAAQMHVGMAGAQFLKQTRVYGVIAAHSIASLVWYGDRTRLCLTMSSLAKC